MYRGKLTDLLNLIQTTQTTIFCDNQGALPLTKSSAKQHQRTKHFDVRYHFVREQSKAMFFNLFAAAEPYTSAKVIHGTP